MNILNMISLQFFLILIFLNIFFFILLMGVYLFLKKEFRLLNKSIEKVVNFTNADPLTHLPNRTLFCEHFNHLSEAARLNQEKLAVLFLDIDHFNRIKDACGFSMADDLLQAIANRLFIVMNNRKELLGRISHDQFILIQPHIFYQKNTTAIIKKILKMLSEPFNIQGHEITITASIGAVIYPDDGKNIEVLLKSASIATFQAKQKGGNTYSFYSIDMDNKLIEQRIIEAQLHNALSKNELTVCYQPKVDIHTRRIIGAEALLQWDNPKLGTVPPSVFIPIAEQNGLINPIGHWALKEACKQTQLWHSEGFSDFSIAVNLSARQFKTGDVAMQVSEVLWETQLKPMYLELELTESVVMENVEKTLLMLRVLKTMGIKISIDDFGTGYSSLSQLQKLPVNSLKIDQSFVKNIRNTSKDTAPKLIITTIIAMTNQLGLQVIAEGVENEQQFNFLKKVGCDVIQGYLFSKPLPAADFHKLLIENHAKSKRN